MKKKKVKRERERERPFLYGKYMQRLKESDKFIVRGQE